MNSNVLLKDVNVRRRKIKSFLKRYQSALASQFDKAIITVQSIQFFHSYKTMSSSPKFKVLELNERMMVRLRIYTHQLTDPKSDFFKSITMYYISFNMIAFIATSVAFAYQNVTNIMVVLRTLMVIVGTSQAFGMFLCIGCKIVKVKMLHRKLQATVDQVAKGIRFSISFSSAKRFLFVRIWFYLRIQMAAPT